MNVKCCVVTESLESHFINMNTFIDIIAASTSQRSDVKGKLLCEPFILLLTATLQTCPGMYPLQ